MTGSSSVPIQPAKTHAAKPWRGETYYGRPQLKPAPFEPGVVGAYIFLAGLSGGAALIGALADAEARRRPRQVRRQRQRLVRRSRYLSLLAPTLGSALLVYDLNTPSRFYNMLRVAKKTSPMSIGTWLLMSFGAFAGLGGGAQIVSDLKPRWRWPRRVATLAQVPAAVTGAVLATYTASLLSATSTPLWAAAPRAIAVRFASSSIAAAAAALAFGERSPEMRRSLGNLMLAALTADLAGTVAADARYKQTGIAAARTGRWDKVEKIGATGFGVLLPIGLLIVSRLTNRRQAALTDAAAIAAVAGSAALRIAMLGAGIESASRPEVTMRFAQPDNLPQTAPLLPEYKGRRPR